MKFIEYKYSEERTANSTLRLNYVIRTFSPNQNISAKEFIRLVKDAYYMFNAPKYKSGYEESMRISLAKLLEGIPSGFDIVDIGAGTGAVYKMVNKLQYQYGKYYFIEPSKDMIDQFHTANTLNDPMLEVKNGTLDSVVLDRKRPKIFVLSGVLRVIDHMDEFIADLKKKIDKSDILFLVIEPNNLAFRAFALSNVLNVLYDRTLGLGERAVSRFKRGVSPKFPKSQSKDALSTMEQSLAYLKDNGIVTSDFDTTHLYALVNYHNYLTWRTLNVPESSDEGFFTPEGIARALGANIINYECVYFFRSKPTDYIGRHIESWLAKLFQRSGAYFSCVYMVK